MKKLCVIGSLNVDLTLRLPNFHVPGETITAISFDTYAGGKGGNQAVAAAKLGFSTLMIGKLGKDSGGDFYRQTLEENHVSLDGIETMEGASTGTALIEVDAKGENRIAIVPGANAMVDRAQIDRLLPLLESQDVFLFQLEIPMDTVCYAAELLHQRGKIVILDPAPAVPLPEKLYGMVDYLTPNATELALLSGMPTATEEEVALACRALIAKGAKSVVAKLGGRGCMYVDGVDSYCVQGFRVQVVDTTAAGDSFNAGLAAAFCQGMEGRSALRFANAVGALSTTGAGAQGAMPSMREVEALMAAQ